MTEGLQHDGNESELSAIEAQPEFARLYVVNTEEVSPETREIARKNQAVILQCLRKATATAVASDLGMSDASISRWLNQGPMATAAMILAGMGLKIVPANALVYIKPEEFN